MERERKVAIDILNEFEEILNQKGIKIPSNDREGRQEEACIYGSEYYLLEDKITDILKGYASVQDNPGPTGSLMR